MKNTTNVSHITINSPRHRRGWIPLRGAVIRDPDADSYGRLALRIVPRIPFGTYSADLRMSNLIATRSIRPGDEVKAVIYQDGHSVRFRGVTVGMRRSIEYKRYLPNALSYAPVTTLIVTVNLVPDESNVVWRSA